MQGRVCRNYHSLVTNRGTCSQVAQVVTYQETPTMVTEDLPGFP
jgi:hypothetical protein